MPPYQLFQFIGIIHRLSCPHTHQQQRCDECKHHHIIDTILTPLADSGVSKTFWDEACQTTCYLINYLPTLVLANFSHFEKLFSSTPNYNFLKIFGYACFSNLRPYNSHIITFHSTTSIFLRRNTQHKGYHCCLYFP